MHLMFGPSTSLHSCFVHVRSEGSGETAHCAGSPEPLLNAR